MSNAAKENDKKKELKMTNTVEITAIEILQTRVEKLEEKIINVTKSIPIFYHVGQKFIHDDSGIIFRLAVSSRDNKYITLERVDGAFSNFDSVVAVKSTTEITEDEFKKICCYKYFRLVDFKIVYDILNMQDDQIMSTHKDLDDAKSVMILKQEKFNKLSCRVGQIYKHTKSGINYIIEDDRGRIYLSRADNAVSAICNNDVLVNLVDDISKTEFFDISCGHDFERIDMRLTYSFISISDNKVLKVCSTIEEVKKELKSRNITTEHLFI